MVPRPTKLPDLGFAFVCSLSFYLGRGCSLSSDPGRVGLVERFYLRHFSFYFSPVRLVSREKLRLVFQEELLQYILSALDFNKLLSKCLLFFFVCVCGLRDFCTSVGVPLVSF